MVVVWLVVMLLLECLLYYVDWVYIVIWFGFVVSKGLVSVEFGVIEYVFGELMVIGSYLIVFKINI